MKPMILTAAFLSGLALAASAEAAPPATATLATPVANETTLIAGGSFWRCTGATCVVESDGDVSAYSSCRDLKSQLGVDIAAISAGSRQLDADHLAKCNRK